MKRQTVFDYCRSDGFDGKESQPPGVQDALCLLIGQQFGGIVGDVQPNE